jgi:hypothetical protein
MEMDDSLREAYSHMKESNQALTQKIIVRLVASSSLFIISLALSAVAFYFYHAKAPIVPLLIGLAGALPASVMLMSLYDLRLLKIKETQQPHQPPNRS